jgi:hemolysin activation/secretion protein
VDSLRSTAEASPARRGAGLSNGLITGLFISLLAAVPAALLPAAAQASAQAAVLRPEADPRFDILEFVIEGDTLLGPAVLERTVYPFLGPGRTLADADGARRALQQAYQDAGYLSVSVLLPPQQVDPRLGEVRLVVQAAAVRRLRVTGAEHFLPSAVKAGLPALAPGSVPQFGEVQAQLTQLAAAAPDRQITPLLAPGATPGSLDVELKVDDTRPLHGAVELNGKRSANTERGRLEAALSFDNLFQRHHGLALNLYTAPTKPSQSSIVSLLYSSDSDTPTPLGGLTVSRGETWRLRWRDRLGAPEGLSHALTWGVVRRHLRDSNLDVAGFSTVPPSLRYTMLQAEYELSLADTASGRSTRLNAGLALSLPALNEREVDCFGAALDQFTCKRAAATARFQVVTLGLEHRQPLHGGAEGWLARVQLQGQFSDAPLPSAEQFVAGGVDSVRGYFEGEQAGDIGLSLRVELWAPRWRPHESLSLRLLGFVDRAGLRRLYALPTEPASLALGSAGFGLRAESRAGFAAALDWAAAVREGAGGDRWSLSVRHSF